MCIDRIGEFTISAPYVLRPSVERRGPPYNLGFAFSECPGTFFRVKPVLIRNGTTRVCIYRGVRKRLAVVEAATELEVGDTKVRC